MTKLNKKKVKAAIDGSAGIYAIIAQKCGVSRWAIQLFLKKERNKDVRLLVEQEREKIIDVGEKKLIELVNARNFNAVKFLLSTKGKSRGYAENRELSINTSTIAREEVEEELMREAAKKSPKDAEFLLKLLKK